MEERKYSLKTAEVVTTIKVAWNGFPSVERAHRFEFKYPILYVTGNRRKGKISIYVFDVDDLEKLKDDIGDSMWWIPRSGTNPRGFGINANAVMILIEKAKKKGNFITAKYQHVNVNTIRERYWKVWYSMLKRLALGRSR